MYITLSQSALNQILLSFFLISSIVFRISNFLQIKLSVVLTSVCNTTTTIKKKKNSRAKNQEAGTKTRTTMAGHKLIQNRSAEKKLLSFPLTKQQK